MECMKWCYGIFGVISRYVWSKRARRRIAERRWLHIVAVVKCGRRLRRSTELSRGLGGNIRDDDHEIVFDVEAAEILLSSPASIETEETEYFSSNSPPDEPIHSSHASFFRVTLEWMFPIANLLLEFLAEVFNQISSKRHPRLGLIGMLMSLATLLVYIIELIYRGHKEKFAWTKRDKIYWFFNPDGLPFGTLIDVVTLICSVLQCVFASIAYAFYRMHVDDPIKLSVWPVIFASGVLCSKFINKCNSQIEPETEVSEI